MKSKDEELSIDPERELNEFRGDKGRVGSGDPIFNDYRGAGGGGAGGAFPLNNDFRAKGMRQGEVITAQRRWKVG